MEHEVFVPVPTASLRRTLSDPARVARCVPGLQQDADGSAGPLSGRLKIRVGGHTITYRGALRVTHQGGDAFCVAGEGVEARGAGSAKLALTIGLAKTDGGTMLEFTGTVSGDGRIVELDEEAALAASHRLVDRFTQQLVTESLAGHEAAESAADRPSSGEGKAQPGGQRSASGSAVDESGPDDESAPASGETSPGETSPDGTPPDGTSPGASSGEASSEGASSGQAPSDQASVFDTPVPPPSLDPAADMEFVVPDEPPAEAAHARRTMIGRSTEEVDHPPPRGRYAPEPSHDALTAGSALRWVVPVAVLVIASAVLVGRALRRRR